MLLKIKYREIQRRGSLRSWMTLNLQTIKFGDTTTWKPSYSLGYFVCGNQLEGKEILLRKRESFFLFQRELGASAESQNSHSLLLRINFPLLQTEEVGS